MRSSPAGIQALRSADQNYCDVNGAGSGACRRRVWPSSITEPPRLPLRAEVLVRFRRGR
jgi:hypothetical protein